MPPLARVFAAPMLALAAASLLAPATAAARTKARHFQLGYAGRAEAAAHRPQRGRLAALVGDRESGLGFYPLPAEFRVGGRFGRRPGNAVREAAAIDAYTSFNGVYGEYGRGRHGHSVFNPVDGYGTPFFAGYYGPAGDPDEDRGLFGRSYD